MSKPKILIQFDSDPHVSTFDSVVALDSGVDQLLAQPNVTEADVERLVHGAIFTRGGADLRRTALFFGGSQVHKTTALVEAAKKCFFGPMRVSLMADPNGSNTTAAAAVLRVQQHTELAGKTIAILAGTGPVGQRIASLVAGPATRNVARPMVRIGSRSFKKAESICKALVSVTDREAGETNFIPVQTETLEQSFAAVEDADVVFAAGSAGVQLLPDGWLDRQSAPSVVVDLNAVPPAGIHGIAPTDKATMRGETTCYGAIGVGGFKMKIHQRCLEMLFESNDRVLELDQVYEVGRAMS